MPDNDKLIIMNKEAITEIKKDLASLRRMLHDLLTAVNKLESPDCNLPLNTCDHELYNRRDLLLKYDIISREITVYLSFDILKKAKPTEAYCIKCGAKLW